MLAFDTGSEKVMALGLYLKFVYIRYIPALEYFLVPKDCYIRLLCRSGQVVLKQKDKFFPGVILVITNGFTSEWT